RPFDGWAGTTGSNKPPRATEGSLRHPPRVAFATHAEGQVPHLGCAGRGFPVPWPGRLRVERLERLEGREVVAGDDERAGALAQPELDLAQRAPPAVFVVEDRGRVGVAERVERVDGVAAEQRVALAQAQQHREVAAGVAGGGEQADAPVAEEVECAAEGAVAGGVRAVEVDGPPVEGVVELAPDVAVHGAELGGGLPLLGGDDERRLRELLDAAR